MGTSRDDNFCLTRGYLALMDQILPGLIKNRVGFGLKKKNPRSVSRLGPGFYKNPARPGYIYIYICIITIITSYIYIYIYIVITLTKMPHLTHNLFRLQSRLSFLSSTHSPLPPSLTLLSCLTSSASLMRSASHLTLFAEEDEDGILRFSPQRFLVSLSHALMFFFHFFFIWLVGLGI